MQGTGPDAGVVRTMLIDTAAVVDGERASLLDAAANARTAAMLTGTHGVVAMPLDRANVRLPAPTDLLAPPAPRDIAEGSEQPAPPWEEREGEPAATALLRARTAAARAGSDPVAILRAQLELAHAQLAGGDREAARASVAAARDAVDHAPAAHALLRTLSAGRERASIEEQLTHVEHLVAHVSDTLVRADFVAEKARLLEADGGPSAASAEAFSAALALVPDHAGALAGLEATLEATERWPQLASLLGRLAGLAGDPACAAWLHVERALVLDRRVGDPVTARAVLEHALELAPGIGPVRQACVDHAVAHRDDARLAALLESEAAREHNPGRAAFLELDGALAYLRSGDTARATKLLEHAHARGRTWKAVDARVAKELARLLESSGRHGDALRVQKAGLANAGGGRFELLALRSVATTAERGGELVEAILALERARVLEGDDPTLLEDLDRLLAAAGRHEARAVLWVREAALADTPREKARALLVAATAATAGGRDVDAARHREAAWIADPSAPGVFDAVAERLVPAGSRDAVAVRAELYSKAAERISDAGRRLQYLEKIAWLWDDVAGDAALAAQAYEDVLAVDPRRRSAIAGLASAAARAGDGRKLARALLAEADVTEDAVLALEVRLRAAEALADVDPERALALAEDLSEAKHPSAARARELVTRLHSAAGRWELVASTLAERGRSEKRKATRIHLALAEAAVLGQQLASPQRALETLEAARELAPADPAIAAAIVATLEAAGDEEKLGNALEALAADASDPEARVAYLVRAAEIAERRSGGDEHAVRLYVLAREALPADRLVAERLLRLGARAPVPTDAVPPLIVAIRSLDAGRPADRSTAETLLGDGARDFATLRVAERLARIARSAPQLANALAMIAEVTRGLPAMRALSALASLVAWALPESERDELEPWGRLVTLGSSDAVVLDDLVRRARGAVLSGDRAALDVSIVAIKRRLEAAADDTERVVLRVELARLQRRAGAARDAAATCREALGLDPRSTGAAVLLAEIASELGDRRGAVASAISLAEVTHAGRARSLLLRDAADLSAAEGDAAEAASLLERALESDPESVLVAARLAQVQTDRKEWAELARALRRGLSRAQSAEAVVPMAAELADVAKTKLRDPLMAIQALERSRAIAPEHVPALFLLAELYIGQRTWDEALRALGDIVTCTTERSERLVALVGRASILARVQDRPADAEKELRAALTIDAHELRALRGLLALPVHIEPKERAELLSRVVVAETQPQERLNALLELARIRRQIGDAGGAEGALVEAAAISPDPAMLARLREAAGGSAEAAARIVGRALARAREAGAAPGATWLAALGELELGLGRVDEAIEHYEEALQLEPSREAVRLALARALSAKGRHEPAAAALMPLLDPGGAGVLDVSFLRQLDEALTGAGRTQQAVVVRELRAIAADLDEPALAALRSRRPTLPYDGETLSAATLRSFVMPEGLGKHPLWDAAAIGAGLAGKIARVGLTEQGASTRDRVKARTVHPIRQLFDRLVRAFELPEIELAVSERVMTPVVACEDAIWVIAPSSMGEWSEAHAIAALARPLARIALGVPWFGALPPDENLAILVALARQVAPNAGALPQSRIESMVGDYEAKVRRVIDRKKKKALDDIEDLLMRAPGVSADGFADAALRTEARAAFLLSGDLRASLDAVAASEPGLADALRVPGRSALAAVLTRPVTRDLVVYALGADATALRRNLGTLPG